jgi:hypothetical protein
LTPLSEQKCLETPVNADVFLPLRAGALTKKQRNIAQPSINFSIHYMKMQSTLHYLLAVLKCAQIID